MSLFGRKQKRIYLDYASATPVDPRVAKAMEPFEEGNFGNPSSSHEEGRTARLAVADARTTIAREMGARAEEIIFTSGGTEGNNLAILGVVRSLIHKGHAPDTLHVLRSSIEHASVAEPFDVLEKEGVKVEVVPVGGDGIVDLGALERMLTPQTVLVSVMYANNEIGTIQPLRDVSRVLHSYKEKREGSLPLYLHADAVQAPLYLDCGAEKLGIDLLTVDAQKLYGPKGVGFLYVRHSVEISPLMYGGGQERALRPGTENVPLIVGCAEAFVLAASQRQRCCEHLTVLRDEFIRQLRARVPNAEINGSLTERLPSNVSISIPGADGEYLVIGLDTDKVSAATGAACSALGGKRQGIVEALGKSREVALGTVRFTLGKATSLGELTYAAEVLARRVKTATRGVNPVQ